MSLRLWLSAGAAALLAAATAMALVAFTGSSAGARSWLDPSLRQLTHLNALPARPAPGFALTDQHGRRVSLASLRGRVVVLDPMDPECTTICPLISQEFVYAARALGAANARVTFVGINVNQFHATGADVLSFSRRHYLSRLANWEFLTGSPAQLRRVWRRYAIAVLPSGTGDVTHSELMYFIDAAGRERWLAFPTGASAAVPAWGRAIAAVARHLLAG